jgi:hypothetical protein
MSQIIPIYIPTFISDQNYNPSRVLPRLFFYNGKLDCETYWLADVNSGAVTRNQFPYFDNYNVVDGEFPTTGSRSLLFNNEEPVYGTAPVKSLYSKYWETYVQLLYNPVTRLINASAIIPFAEYTKLELNDVIEWRGNYYHLRAINDYSVKTGECTIQLLGPIISDTFTSEEFDPEPPATVNINLSEFNSASIFVDATLTVSGSAYTSSGNFSQSISGETVGNVVMEGKSAGSTAWGGYTTASATLTILNNGTTITSSTQYIYSGSSDTTITIPTTFTAGDTITISGSTAIFGNPTPPPPGTFTLDAQYGMNITNVTSNNGTIPGFTFPQDSGDPQQTLTMTSGYNAGTIFTVSLSGTRVPVGDKSVSIYVNSVQKACATISVDGTQSKNLTVASSISIGDNVRIAIDSNAC